MQNIFIDFDDCTYINENKEEEMIDNSDENKIIDNSLEIRKQTQDGTSPIPSF